MPDGPLAAAIVLVAGLVLLVVGYVLTEGFRPGRGRRHHYHRESERLPLFGTDQLVVRRNAEPATDADAGEEGAGEEGTEDQAGTIVASASHPSTRPVPRPNLPLPPAPGVQRWAERPNGRHDAAAHAAEPHAPIPSAPLPPSLMRPSPARPAAERVPVEQSFDWPVSAPPAPGRRPAIAPPGVPDGAFVDGETIRFAIPTDRTLQFLPGRLEVVAGPDTGREIRFVRTPGGDAVEVTFGRAEGPLYRHVQLHARTVSRQHAMMSLIDEHWELRNLSMTNPVVLNGRVLAHNEVAPLLVEGDRIEMGEVVFLFHER